jgi:hypothetical protein
VTTTRAKIAATRLTTDSAASESSPTDPVNDQAVVLRLIVATAAAIESQSMRLRRWWRESALGAGAVMNT